MGRYPLAYGPWLLRKEVYGLINYPVIPSGMVCGIVSLISDFPCPATARPSRLSLTRQNRQQDFANFEQ